QLIKHFSSSRREVYRILKNQECNLVEGEDHVEVNGEVFQKPFVEKPVSAEDHNVYIYYPTSAGGGSQRLFRKIGSRSSVYSPESNVRKTGSYIYEEFMPTDGTDVKVYTVGPDYAHAEARKSPALDGKVERDSEGKEVRYPVILNAREKLIAWKVCLAFKQTVCGFDLLRANGQSYVCDVNGFSFVKNSMKYYDDCAKILGMELRCVIAVIRHGDRTPKQKMKMEVRHQRYMTPVHTVNVYRATIKLQFFDLFEKCGGYKNKKLKLKKPKQLQEVLDIARQLLVEIGQNNDSEIEESKAKLEQLKTVLEMYGHFSGINRKVQMTYLPNGCPKTSSEEEDVRRDDPSLLLVLKWGGELTPAGRVQAEELGRAFRCMYPGGQGDYAGFPGCGLLRLHSTYRHDLKIYASDEGRMVKSANMNGLLDSDSDSLSSCQQRVKARLHEILQRDRDFTAEDYEKLAPTTSSSLIKSMQMIKNPVKTCDKVYALIQSLTLQIRQRMEEPKSADIQLYHSETLDLMLRRWAKLEKDFRMKNGRYNISKIPDIYDCIKYDVQHNSSLNLTNTMEIYRLSKALADIVIPQEYGIAQPEKLDIAKGYCTPLIRKIRSDLQRTQDDDTVNKLHPVYSRGVMSPERHVRTRLYFTSESHVHSLLSILRYGAFCDETKDDQWKRAMEYLKVVSELNYMTQIVIMLYEDPNKGCEDDKNLPSGFGYRPASRENEGSKKKSKEDNDEESAAAKRDEPDRAALMMFRPLVSEPIYINRKCPLPRSKKIGSVESPLQPDFIKTAAGKEESPLSVSNPDSIGNWLHYTCGVGTGRRRRRSGDQITSSPVSPKSLAFTSSIFGSWQQVLSENNAHAQRPGRLYSEHKLTPGVGSHCAGLFSTMVLGASSSAPNLQDYARVHRKKLTSSGFLDEATRGSAVKRFSISFARHPTNGFELYSMVPSICPLETLHNSLSLKQIDDFLASIAASHESLLEISASSPAGKKTPLNTYTPAKILPCPFTQGKKNVDKAATGTSSSPTKDPRSGSANPSPNAAAGDKASQQSPPQPTTESKAALEPTSEDLEPPAGLSATQHSPNDKLEASTPDTAGDKWGELSLQRDAQSCKAPPQTQSGDTPPQSLAPGAPSGKVPSKNLTQDYLTCKMSPHPPSKEIQSGKVLPQTFPQDTPSGKVTSLDPTEKGSKTSPHDKVHQGLTSKGTLGEGARSLTTSKEREAKLDSK
ncbi:unnamed protein product, partial [Coregonus sp. 'balchen']